MTAIEGTSVGFVRPSGFGGGDVNGPQKSKDLDQSNKVKGNKKAGETSASSQGSEKTKKQSKTEAAPLKAGPAPSDKAPPYASSQSIVVADIEASQDNREVKDGESRYIDARRSAIRANDLMRVEKLVASLAEVSASSHKPETVVKAAEIEQADKGRRADAASTPQEKSQSVDMVV